MLSSILYGLAHVVNIILSMANVVVIISIGISWFSGDPRNPFVASITAMTEPMYRPFRRWTRGIAGPFDLAPMCVLLVIIFLQKAVPTYLMMLSESFK